VPQKRPQYFLADLVAIVALCGLVLAIVRMPGQQTSVISPLLLALVFAALIIYRRMRGASTCDECGRRFTRPRTTVLHILCPRCGHRQQSHGWLQRTQGVLFQVMLGFAIVAVIAIVQLVSLAVSLTGLPPSLISRIASYRIIAFFPLWLLLGVTIVLRFARSRFNSARRKPLPCERCGIIIPPEAITEPLICHRCRLHHLPPEQSRKEQAKGWLIMVAMLLLAGIGLAILLGDWASSRLGLNSWTAIPLVIIATIIGFPAACLIIALLILVPVNLVHRRRFRSERAVLASARKASREQGEVVRTGVATGWYSGPTNPMPLLLEQIEATRQRFESLLGRDVAAKPPRILCFHERSAFQVFVKPVTAQILYFLKTVDGIYLRRPHRLLTICTDLLLYRLSDFRKTAGALFAYHYAFEASADGSPPPWLQRGISKAFTSDADDRARLNRRILSALSRGTTLGADLFRLNDRELLKLLKGWSNHDSFVRFEQFNAESWSVFEYLGGEQAPQQRRDQFRAFLNDNQLKKQPDEVSKHHFGFGLNHLLEAWRAWVQTQGIGGFTSPPAQVQEGLLTRVIPLIENRQAKREDRILAIRHVGIEGHVLGADALISLLHSDATIPTEEVVWALEAISGMTYGEDQDRWTDWGKNLPVAIRDRCCPPAEE
jgi:hypothetical protein